MQNLSSRDTQMRGHPVIRGHILRMLRNMIVMKGNFRDTFSKILRCPLKTGFTVITQFQKIMCPLINNKM